MKKSLQTFFVIRIIFFTSLAFLIGCKTENPAFTPDPASGIHQWSKKNFKNKTDNFQFAIVADRNSGCRTGIFENAISKLNLLQPEFVMCVGDLINGYTNDLATLSNEWCEVESFINKLEMPFFYVAGNHDIYDSPSLSIFDQRHGNPYYYFSYRNVLFLCLNTEDPPPSHISDEQVEYFRDALNSNRQTRWVMLFMHEPLWQMPEDKSFAKIEELLKDKSYTVFAGHHHTYEKTIRNGQTYYKLATTGGGSSLQPEKGQFDGIAWITMTDTGPILLNLLLNGIFDDISPQPPQ